MYTLSGIQGELGSGTGHEKQNDWNVPKSFHDKSDAFVRWATYQTGVPLIDANMKELALTGCVDFLEARMLFPTLLHLVLCPIEGDRMLRHS